ncbi:membrane protein FAM174B [Syngnathoides biaculeatus]|uniref:membrane protein FAM174B n=1 Tax=Syngnathoides biaculeatus TaxID=300417 RepID=UPI002ADD5175|nr:membrane protein FAM174B [Syngnathoides biaculeatus]
MATFYLALAIIAAALWRVGGEPRTLPSSPPSPSNATSAVSSPAGLRNGTGSRAAAGPPAWALTTHLPTLKVIVICTCVLTGALISCLLAKVLRSGRRIRKTRKYDIITTPAERVEMAPLNDDNEDEDDSTLFDVNYR